MRLIPPKSPPSALVSTVTPSLKLTIAPGSTLTAFSTWRLQNTDGSTNQEAYDTFIENMKGMSPLGTIGEAIDQAQLMLYLASDAARFVKPKSVR